MMKRGAIGEMGVSTSNEGKRLRMHIYEVR